MKSRRFSGQFCSQTVEPDLPFQTIAALVSLTAVFSWVNRRYLQLPSNIALLAMSGLTSLGLVFIDLFLPGAAIPDMLKAALGKIDFYQTVVNGMLAFLLFSAAVNMDWQALRSRAPMVALLATLGVVVSAFMIGGLTWLLAQLCGFPVAFAWCVAFGALIAPTDPVAVISALKSGELPEVAEIEISGEALFNDGVSIVLFVTALQFAMSGPEKPTLGEVGIDLSLSLAGGCLLGFATGFVAYRALKSVNDYSDEILFSIGLAMGTYALAGEIGASGPVSVVVAGVFIGNRGARKAMSDKTEAYFFNFWALIDHVLNGILFTLLGLQVIVLNVDFWILLTGLGAIPLVLAVRYAAVSAATFLLGPWLDFGRGSALILTWSGIRGAISAALALVLPEMPARPYILAATYAVIVFSVIVQGLTLPSVARYVTRGA